MKHTANAVKAAEIEIFTIIPDKFSSSLNKHNSSSEPLLWDIYFFYSVMLLWFHAKAQINKDNTLAQNIIPIIVLHE